MSGQYSMAKHTIIPLVLKIIKQKYISYLIRDPATRSAMLMPAPQHTPETLLPHVNQIQKLFDCKLTHTLLNHAKSTFTPVKQQQLLTVENQGDLKPLLVGDLSLCFITAPGYSQDYSLISATHITASSTKLPVLFPGNLISICSVDLESSASGAQYMSSLKRLKFFSNQTLLFPAQTANESDLKFAAAIDKSGLVPEKLKMLQANALVQDCMIPTSMLQQKIMNPFLSPEKQTSLLKATRVDLCFDMLRKLRKQWRQ